MSGQIHLGGQARHIVGFVDAVDLVAQIAQADLFVTRILGDEFRQHAPQRLVLVVVVLELLQLSHHGVPASLGDADGEHDEERIQAAFLHDHAVLGQDIW